MLRAGIATKELITINGWEFIIIFVLAMLLIGPERLPGYAAKLREWVRSVQQFADGAKNQLREQMGPEFDDIDWKSYDPRQYDPRRIVREALLETGEQKDTPLEEAVIRTPVRSVTFDPNRPTPFDNEAT
ncbi:preprotein translocase subunit TatA [Dermatophilus congolensis]|uniref:Sec-independent translocase n=1 Tax=Dermatophilus congolensis TaxID=1863 RepID=A0A239VPT9_9MICO|nr:preprotein translocase subunit TatA [Dermatophilus congolensis]SNV24112.1 sec-independent translocase [Dermatophilus congolensis]